MTDTKRSSCGGCLGLAVMIIVGGSFFAAMVQHPSAPTTGATSPAPPLTPSAESEPVAPRGNKQTDWTHSSFNVNGKMIGAILSVKINDDLRVEVVTSFGAGTYALDEVPQGFLDDWGVTGAVIDKEIGVALQKAKERRDALAREQQRKNDEALDGLSQNVGFKVAQVLSPTEVLGSQESGDGGFQMIHVSGIDTSDVVEGQYMTVKAWRVGVFRYVSVLGASSQIADYTCNRNDVPAPRP